MIHIDGYYNINEMAEVSGKTYGTMYGRLMFFKEKQFKTISFDDKVYAEKDSFDDWVRRGAPNRKKAKLKEYESNEDMRRDCKFFFGCKLKININKTHKCCNGDCRHYEMRGELLYPTIKIAIEGKTAKEKINNFITRMNNEIRTKAVSERSSECCR